MSEILKRHESETSEKRAEADWDSLTELAGKYSTERPVHGLSSDFKREAAEHQLNADKFYDQASTAQKEGLKEVGFRDAKDAAEYLHEQESWNRQVDEQAKIIGGNVEVDEEGVLEIARANNRDPFDGRLINDESFADGDTEQQRESMRRGFLNALDRNAPIFESSPVYKLAKQDMLGDKLSLDEQDTELSPKPRSKEALLQEAEERWLSNKERMDEVRKYGSYAVAKRKIEKKLAESAAKSESIEL